MCIRDSPYTVAEQNFTVRRLQPRGDRRHAVLFSHPREALTYHYEREPADPRIQHALTLAVDDFGNVLKEAAVGYGRRVSPLTEQWDRERQTTLVTYTENDVTAPLSDPATHPNDCLLYTSTRPTPGASSPGSSARRATTAATPSSTTIRPKMGRISTWDRPMRPTAAAMPTRGARSIATSNTSTMAIASPCWTRCV